MSTEDSREIDIPEFSKAQLQSDTVLNHYEKLTRYLGKPAY